VRVDLMTREYPPKIYGGAGVHVAELVRVLRAPLAELGGAPGTDVQVHCFDGAREDPWVHGYDQLPGDAALATFGVDLAMVAGVGAVDPGASPDLVHSHTWYANLAGHLAGVRYDVPHILTAHSLEPLRPWKAEQLGGGYALSSWAERTAYAGAARVVAVSAGMRADILRVYPFMDPEDVVVVHNGIDLDGWARPADTDAALARARDLGIDPDRPAVVFVGRITRQKGLPYFLRAAELLPADVQLVLCAGAPDTPQIMAEVQELVAGLAAKRSGVVWIERMLPRDELVSVLSACTVFVCPSVYEPLGIVNLEAMAVGLPVVGTATGGIPEVVVDGETGILVPIEQTDDGTGTPLHPETFVSDLAAALTDAVSDPARARTWGEAGRRRAEDHFSWEVIGERTLEVYRSVLR